MNIDVPVLSVAHHIPLMTRHHTLTHPTPPVLAQVTLVVILVVAAVLVVAVVINSRSK